MDEQKRTNRKGIIILIVVLLLLAAMAFGIWMLLRGGNDFTPSLGGTTGTTGTTQGTPGSTESTGSTTGTTGSTGATDSNTGTTGPNTDTTVPGDDTTTTNPDDQNKPSTPNDDSNTPTDPAQCSHDYTVTETAATCDKDGSRESVCRKCGHKIVEALKAPGHNYGKWETKKAATCDSEGLQIRSCIVCGNAQQETIKATGHSYGSWKTTKQPTCDTNGTKERTCSKCKHAQQETIAATGHAWDNGKVTKVPNSCDDVGIKTYTCSTCGKTRVEQMKGNHSFGEWQWEEYEYQETYKNRVYTYTSHRKYRLCTACGYREDVNTPDHNCKYSGEGHSRPYVLQKGNCQTKEIWATKCSICDWVGTYDKGYGDHDTVTENRHLTDYTETTDELDVVIYTCKACDLLEYSWKFGKGWDEGTDAVQHTVAPNNKMFGHNLTDYLEHPTWQIVNRDYVYDSNGKVIQYTKYWYDYDGKRHSCVVDVLAIPDMFAAAGYDVEYYKSKGIVTWHCTISPYSDKLEASRVSWVAIGG